MEESPRYLRSQDVARIREAGFSFLDLYKALSMEAEADGKILYHRLRKIHPIIHMLDDLVEDGLNPRHYSGWTDETFMRWFGYQKAVWPQIEGCNENALKLVCKADLVFGATGTATPTPSVLNCLEAKLGH